MGTLILQLEFIKYKLIKYYSDKASSQQISMSWRPGSQSYAGTVVTNEYVDNWRQDWEISFGEYELKGV